MMLYLSEARKKKEEEEEQRQRKEVCRASLGRNRGQNVPFSTPLTEELVLLTVAAILCPLL